MDETQAREARKTYVEQQNKVKKLREKLNKSAGYSIKKNAGKVTQNYYTA